MNLLDPLKLRFGRTGTGPLALSIEGGVSYLSVACVQLFPLSDPGRYVSVCDASAGPLREIGIIKDLSSMEPSQRGLVEADIKFRYFVPEITEITRISGRRGIDTWDVVTDRGKKALTVQDTNENVSITDGGVVFVTDVAGCRYKIRDLRSLPRKSRMMLEKVLL